MTDDTLARIEAHMQRGNELIARIDEHLERGITDFSPEHLASGAEFEARLAEHIERCEKVIEAGGKSYDDWRFSMRQDSLRNERILGEISQSMRSLGERFDRMEERAERRMERVDDRIDEIRADGKAYREALFRMLDKLDGKGDPSDPG
jgi:uncharacterized protein YukE